MRTRINQDLSSFETFTNTWVVDGALQSSTETPFLSSRDYSCMIDSVTPDYKKRSARGEIILNPMSYEVLNYSSGALEFDYSMVASGDIPCSGHMGVISAEIGFEPFLPDNGGLFSDMFTEFESSRNSAIATAWSNVDESAILVAASLGELPETVRWMASLTSRFISLLRKLKKKKMRYLTEFARGEITRKQMTDKISDLWLEMRYAFRPLLFDMKQAAEAFEKELDTSLRFTARGFSDDSSSSTNQYIDNTGYANYVKSVKTTKRYTARAGVLYQITGDANSVVTIWGLDQPFEVVWELTPFSFIVDWFLNIGDVISAWSKNASLTVLGSWVSEQILMDEFFTAVNVTADEETPPYEEFAVSQISLPDTQCGRIFKRRVITPDRPTFPSIAVNLDVAKILDLALIARGLFQSFSRK